jgi:thiosulfate/3-mercaptopyruvate sulfurtransferase
MTRRPQFLEPRPNFKRVSVGAACTLMLRSDILIFDVRDAQSYAQGHILGAQHLCDANMHQVLTAHEKNRPVLIYCYHGNMSQSVAQMLIDFAFREVYSMDGGYESWRLALGACAPADAKA